MGKTARTRRRAGRETTASLHARRYLCALLPALVLGLSSCGQETDSRVGETAKTRGVSGVLPEAAAKPDIVMILIDTLRADRLGAYGHPGRLSPTIDAIAASGVTFEHCIAAAPWTLPSVASLFTSYYPGVHKASKYKEVPDPTADGGKSALQSALTEDVDTLAEVLQGAGYQTAGFVGAKFLRAQFGFAQGFEHYDTSFADSTLRGKLINDAALDWVGTQRDPARPLFLYLHYMDVHGPYDAAPEFMDPLMAQLEALPNKQRLTAEEYEAIHPYLRQPPRDTTTLERYERLKNFREYWVARYEAGVKEVDFYISQLIERLTDAGIWNDAYVILLADHGEALCEHGIWEHGYSMYQTDLHVPLILRWPGVLPAGKRVPPLVSTIDLMPTLIEQLHLSSPQKLQGASLLSHIFDTGTGGPITRFAEAIREGPDEYAVIQDYAKLITTARARQQQRDGTARAQLSYRLFDLKADPAEEHDLAPSHPALVKRLGQVMTAVVRANLQLRPDVVAAKVMVDPQTMRELAALGYVGSPDYEDEPNEAKAESQPGTGTVGQTGARRP